MCWLAGITAYSIYKCDADVMKFVVLLACYIVESSNNGSAQVADEKGV